MLKLARVCWLHSQLVESDHCHLTLDRCGALVGRPVCLDSLLNWHLNITDRTSHAAACIRTFFFCCEVLKSSSSPRTEFCRWLQTTRLLLTQGLPSSFFLLGIVAFFFVLISLEQLCVQNDQKFRCRNWEPRSALAGLEGVMGLFACLVLSKGESAA